MSRAVKPEQVAGINLRSHNSVMHWLGRYLLLGLALLSLGVALLGIVLPGLPTTEFLLLAAWAAARSSPRLHTWMLNHRLFGPTLQHWQQGRLPRHSKWVISASMSLAALMLALSLEHLPSLVFCLLSMAAVLIWLWCKPEPVPCAPAAGTSGH